MASLIQRGKVYYAQWYVGRKIQRMSLQTSNYQLAKEKLRQVESAQLRGADLPMPTRTPIAQIVAEYVRHIRTAKTPKSAQTDIYYLRDMFGMICPELEITSRKRSTLARKRKPGPDFDKRRKLPIIAANAFEEITTAAISTFISTHVQIRGIKPKTANRYREILSRLFNWSMETRGIRLPNDINPVIKVEKYTERAPEIRFLALEQIQQQLAVLKDKEQLQTMVAVLIYAGLRREELLWLTIADVDLNAGLIRVRAKTINGQSWQPKTKVNRVVPISITLRSYLQGYTPLASTEGWYFPSPQGHLWDPDNFSQDLRVANHAANLKWGCLDFRHTFGSQLAMKGESLYKIATLMGNSPEICRRHYAALMPESLVESVEFGTGPKASLKLSA
jgi:integrase